MMSKGILAFGAYIPWRRLPRKTIAETHGWFAPGLKGQAKGERAFCNWDEDAVTMAVEAARDVLTGRDRASIKALRFASTTFPFLDRLHSGIVAEALSLDDGVSTIDITAAQRAATSALIEALASDNETLVVAAEKRNAKAASPVEMTSGDGAAAVLVGEGKPIAKLLGNASRTADFVDHYRSLDNQYDYQWEERWIRDAGYMPIVPPVIRRCLESAGVAAKDVAHFCMPSTVARVANTVAKATGLDEKSIADPLHANCGDTGAAHPLMMLAATLEKAKPGEKILLVGFGQGADALLFEVTPEIGNQPKRLGVAGHLARRKEETSYGRYLAFNDLIELERGMRAEADKGTALSSMWRNRDTVTGFIGGKCSKCGTLQFPKTDVCVNPNCNAIGTQQPHPFAEMGGRIKSYTADRLTYSPDPPSCYGMIEFEEGGRVMIDFTDIDAERLQVGQPMRMMFRIKDIDTSRGFRRYFWKAAPVAGKAPSS
jgi:3-hydroxy-3-methylglutaryl CoA synthase